MGRGSVEEIQEWVRRACIMDCREGSEAKSPGGMQDAANMQRQPEFVQYTPSLLICVCELEESDESQEYEQWKEREKGPILANCAIIGNTII